MKELFCICICIQATFLTTTASRNRGIRSCNTRLKLTTVRPYQMAETSEEGIGQHKFPSFINVFRDGLVYIIRGEGAEHDE